MKVAIWGSYNHGNYGDDVMAVMFAKSLQQQGVQPCVYRIDKAIAQEHGFQTVNSLDELLQNTSFSIIGGGSWLEKRAFGGDYEDEFAAFHQALKRHNCPCYGMSIGGDFSMNMEDMQEKERLRMLQSPFFCGASVRLKTDAEMLQKANKIVNYAPDIVLATSSFFPVKTEQETPKRVRIALNLHTSHRRVYNTINRIISRFYHNYEFYYVQTHLPNFENKYEYQVEKETKNLKNFRYQDINSFTQFVSSVDLMITFKLHPGVTALSYGVPFYLLGGYDKTLAFLKSVDATDASQTETGILKKLFFQSIPSIKKQYNFQSVLKQQKACQGHIEFLNQLVNKYANK